MSVMWAGPVAGTGAFVTTHRELVVELGSGSHSMIDTDPCRASDSSPRRSAAASDSFLESVKVAPVAEYESRHAR